MSEVNSPVRGWVVTGAVVTRHRRHAGDDVVCVAGEVGAGSMKGGVAVNTDERWNVGGNPAVIGAGDSAAVPRVASGVGVGS